MRLVWKVSLLLVGLFIFTACGNIAGDPSDTVERYIEAKVASDTDTISSLLCSSMESDLQRETTSFATVVEARVENMECARVGDTNTVACTGEIVANYGAEDLNFELGTYSVVQEDGEWRWCGESQ